MRKDPKDMTPTEFKAMVQELGDKPYGGEIPNDLNDSLPPPIDRSDMCKCGIDHKHSETDI